MGSSTDIGSGLRAGVAPSEAAAAVSRVLASSTFKRSPTLRELLSYLAAETLAGRGDALTERTVARRALRRGAHFDGRDDASVRVSASRLRQRLERYYADEGREDAVRVALPTGTYTLAFIAATGIGQQPIMAHDASIGVLRLDEASRGDGRADLISGLLVHQLARFPGIRVVGPSHLSPADTADLARELGVRFLLQGSLQETSEGTGVSLRLTDASDRSVIWSVSDLVNPATDGGLDTIDSWAAAAAAELGDYAGVILRRLDSEDSAAGRELDAHARHAFYRHITQGHVESMAQARDALTIAVDAGTKASDVLAMWAFMLALTAWNDLTTDRVGDLEKAEKAARRALNIEPSSAQAFLALALVAAVRRQWSLGRTHAQSAAALAPTHPSTLFSAGSLMVVCGHWAEGAELIRRSFALNPRHPGYQNVNLAVERLLCGDLPSALAEASIVDAGGGVWGPMCRALSLAGLGYDDSAIVEMQSARTYNPDIVANIDGVFADVVISDQQRHVLHSLVEPFAHGGRCALPD